MNQGTIFTASEAKNQVKEASRNRYGQNVWNNAYGQLDLNFTKSEQELSAQYDSQLADAYSAAQLNKSAIYGSGLGQGYQELALMENKKTLNDAFESYKLNYLSSKGEIDDARSNAVSQIDNLIFNQSSNVADYANAHFDYINWLYENNADLFKNDINWSKFTYTDENGVTHLMNRGQLTANFFNDDNTLNDRGVDFFNQVEGYGALGGGFTFGDYLAKEKPELFDWAISENVYSYGQRNDQLAKDLIGINGDKWSPSDVSFTDAERSSMHTTLYNEHDSLISEYDSGVKSTKDSQNFYPKVVTAKDNLIRFATQYGVMNDPEVAKAISKINSDFDEYENTVDNKGKGDGSNKKNREWAVSNAMADYQALYTAIMNAVGWSDVERTIEGTMSYEERKKERNARWSNATKSALESEANKSPYLISTLN